MKLPLWLTHHPRKLAELADTPESIATGAAIGIFFGFVPLFGLKTLLALGLAWLLRSNKIAAAVGVTLHDVILPFVPLLLRIEYDVGYWLVSHPHRLPVSMTVEHLHFRHWLHWTTFLTAGGPLLLGSAIVALPFTAAAYFATKAFVTHHRKHLAAAQERSGKPDV